MIAALFSQIVERRWPSSAIHDTVQAVLREPAFRRSTGRSLADRLLMWLLDWLERATPLLRHLPSTRSLGLALIGLLVLFVVTRFVLANRWREGAGMGGSPRRSSSSLGDPWLAADALIAERRYEEAAQALYRGVILSIVRDERLRLDPSRTSGDYARELRRRGATSLVPFRAFTRRFDVAVYGYGGVGDTAVGELRALSAPFRRLVRAA